MQFHVTVTITPKAGLRDPEGSTILDALHALGHREVAMVHVGRQIHLDVTADNADAAAADVHTMCQRILANPVIEDFTVAVAAAAGAGA